MNSENPERTYARWPLRDVPGTPATDVLLIGPEADGINTVFDDDSRKLVGPKDYRPGGKYHSIVKLQIRFEGQDASDTRHAQATGWLIMPHLIVTAAHCVYDHTYDFGKAIQVCAYVGYNGKNSIDKPGVQFRRGLKVVILKDWIISDTNRGSDVAFTRVDEFSDVVRIAQQPTNGIVEKMFRSVVEYPCDKSLGDERGAQMKVTAIGQRVDHSVLRTGSLFLGQVGSPVAAVAGTALGVLSKLGAGASIDIGSVHVNYRQCAARAIVAETAMQTLVQMDPHQANRFKIFDKIEDQFPETKDVVPRVAQLITPGIIESALRISVNAQAGYENTSRLYPTLPSINGSLSVADKRFADAFTRYTNQGDGNVMSEFLSSIVNTGLSAGSPQMDDITRVMGESEFSVTDMSTHVEILCHRALIGDTALKSLIAIPLDQMMQNGLFDHFVGTVGNIGRTVIAVAPVVVQNILNDLKQSR
ncbi:hypothetical protein J7337_012305 [Fusarium musae]|uniref:Peptidase S1 domain-containing protein n=1 Tax=Fusarium musae TaxID=1042133 RepID=A0A9P8D5Q3_9HYPO|nr:hypothetical protein J7337_012305 [Fusarium musae]KAG9495747.1 hypothetical protein J7337_012305 [Fusarium musae]